MGFPAIRLTVHALDVVLSVRRRYHFIYIYKLYFTAVGSQTIKHTVKYTKYTFADRRTLIADMLLMGGRIRQRCASCHVTPSAMSIARGKPVPSSIRNIV